MRKPSHPGPSLLAHAFNLLCLIDHCWAQTAVQNVTFQNTRSELVYIPELCNTTNDGPTPPSSCEGAWTVVDLQGSSNGSVSTTTGPSAQFADILPQVFFTFRGFALYVKTSDVSNATANLTVSAQPSGSLLSRVFAPSMDFWSFTNLDESQTITMAVTFLPGSAPTHLDIDFIKISVSNASASSSFLPSQTIPPAEFTPTFASFTTSSSPTETDPTSASKSKAVIGGSLGGLFALLLIVLVAFLIWYRRWSRRRQERRETTMRAQAIQQITFAAPEHAPPTPPVTRWRDTARSFGQSSRSATAELGHW